MAGCSKKQYAIMMSSGSEGEQLAAKMGGMEQEEFNKAFAELMGKSGSSVGTGKEGESKTSSETLKWSKEEDEDYAEFDPDSDDDYGFDDARRANHDEIYHFVETNYNGIIKKDAKITKNQYYEILEGIENNTLDEFDDAGMVLDNVLEDYNIMVLDEEDKYDDSKAYVYTMPSEQLTDEDRKEIEALGLEIIGDKGGDVSIKGDMEGLEAFFNDYVGVEMNPDYLSEEDDFDYETFGGFESEDDYKDRLNKLDLSDIQKQDLLEKFNGKDLETAIKRLEQGEGFGDVLNGVIKDESEDFDKQVEKPLKKSLKNEEYGEGKEKLYSELTSAYQEDAIEEALESSDSKEEMIKASVENYTETLKKIGIPIEKARQKYGDETHVADIAGRIWDLEHDNYGDDTKTERKVEVTEQKVGDDIRKNKIDMDYDQLDELVEIIMASDNPKVELQNAIMTLKGASGKSIQKWIERKKGKK